MAIQIERMLIDDIKNPTPKRLAAAVLDQLAEISLPIPVDEIALACGISSIAELTTPGFEGALIANDAKSEGVILVSNHNTNHPHRRRFTIGHELGHFLNPWHVPPEGGFQCSQQQLLYSDSAAARDRNKMEAEANEFATEILMPSGLFQTNFRQAGGDVTTQATVKLSSVFGVSKLAAARRLVDLRKDCAVVLSHDGLIEQVYRGSDCPFLTHRAGQKVPRNSVTFTHRGSAGVHSEIEEVDAETWTTASTKRGLQFLEQVLIQDNAYRLTLLVLDESECDDEEEKEVRERSDWNPSFHRSRRK